VPERARWIVEAMEVRPQDVILEIGCGHGAAVGLVCARLAGGRIVAIDRSAAMTKVARQRNQEHLASGRAVIQTVPLAAVDLAGQRFDKVFAMNVNLFWVRSAEPELEVVRRLLRPGGAMYLGYQPPDPARAAAVAGRTAAFLAERGFTTTVLTGVSPRSPALACVVARPG
jgi:cyclopropane fatty-acyl-phospholipid synthase-like methyltransferase